jgi:HK97 family phage major capsid protein
MILDSNQLATLQASGIDGVIASVRENLLMLIARAQRIQASADGARRDLTVDESRRIEGLFAQCEKAESDLQELEADGVNAIENQLPSAGRRLAPSRPGERPGDVYFGDVGGLRSRGATFTAMFGQPRPNPYGGAFKNLGEFALAVASGKMDPRLMTNASMSETTGGVGGFLVPEQWAMGILDAALAQEAIRPRALVLPMTALSLTVPGFDYLDGTGAKRAGLQLIWGGESQALTEQQGKTRSVGLVAKKGSILVRCSTELVEDAGAFTATLSNAMTAAVQIGLDTAFLQGSGVAQPLGIALSPAAIVIAKEGSQAANTIMLQNLTKMMGRLSPSSYAKAIWFCHPTTVPLLLQLTVAVSNVANTDFVGGSTAGLVTQENGVLRIAGKEVVVTDACNVLSSVGDVVLADISQYCVGLRRDISIEASRDVYFASDEWGFRLRLRLDGQPLAAAPVKLRDGTNTVSPFIVLGAR